MSDTTRMAAVAALLGDPARANILTALMDGRALTAKELAFAAHVSPATTSGHLARLTDAALLARLSQLAVKHPSNGRISGGVVPQGRHHRMDGDYAIGMPSVVILGGGWSGKLILSR